MKLSTKIFLPIILISALLILLNGCFLTPSEEQPAVTAVTLYTVTYNGNGSTGGAVPIDATFYKKGDIVKVLGNTGTPALVNTGYKFYGWNTAADANDGTDRPVGYTFAMGEADVILYAMWGLSDVSPAFTPTPASGGGGGGGGGGGVPTPPAAPCVDRLEVDPESKVLCYDNIGSFTLDAIYDDANVESLLDNDAVIYVVDDPGIVSVDKDGTITALGCGETTINISYTDPVCGGDPKTASIEVEVKGALIGLKVTPTDPIALCVNDRYFFTLQAIYNCGGPISGLVSLLDNDDVDYDYDESIITVDNDGTITTVGCGETTINISYTDSVCEVEKTASIEVTVKGTLTGLLVTTDPDPMKIDSYPDYCGPNSGSFTLQAIYNCGGPISGLVSLLGNKGVDYSGFNTSLITVDGDTGRITAKDYSCGTTTIYISYTDSVCEVEKTASIYVEVKRCGHCH